MRIAANNIGSDECGPVVAQGRLGTTIDATLQGLVLQVAEFGKRFRADRLVDPEDVVQDIIVRLLSAGTPGWLRGADQAAVNTAALYLTTVSMRMARRTAGRYAAMQNRFEGVLATSAYRRAPRTAEDAVAANEMAAAVKALDEAARAEIYRRHSDPDARPAANDAARGQQFRAYQRALKLLKEHFGISTGVKTWPPRHLRGGGDLRNPGDRSDAA